MSLLSQQEKLAGEGNSWEREFCGHTDSALAPLARCVRSYNQCA